MGAVLALRHCVAHSVHNFHGNLHHRSLVTHGAIASVYVGQVALSPQGKPATLSATGTRQHSAKHPSVIAGRVGIC